ncbi:fungal-specific transcription factor domain-containing protein [Pyronema domesticum]|nr:fungal-specific transcription factor domain-containing protein [Pyronema domesticum]
MQSTTTPTPGQLSQQVPQPTQVHLSQTSQASQGPQGQPPQPSPVSPNEARSARRRVAASARKRIANACLACKSRKQKCDGQQPCNICSRRGAACIYVEQPARNTKGSRRRESNVNGDGGAEGSVVADDEGGVTPTGGNGQQNLNQQQQQQQGQGLNPAARTTRSPSTPGQSQNNNQHILSIRSERLDSVASSDHTDPQFAYPTPTNPTTQSLASGTEASDELDTDDDKIEAPVDHRTRMLSDPSGRLLYIGETGSLSFLARVRKLAKDALGPSSFTSDSAQFSIADKPIIRSHHLPSTHASLPPYEVASTLIDLFFTHVNSVYYVLDRSEMEEIVTVVYAGQLLHATITARNRDIGFVNAVCAIGTFFLCPSGGQQEQQQAQQDGMLYFDVARSMLEDVYESADFWSIRLLLLFALYMQYAAKRNAAWTYVGLAIRIAESLGLHRIWSIELSEKPLEERRRRLVFWSLYVLDRFTGCSLGRPLAIEDENCNDPVFSTTAYTGDDLLDNQCSTEQGQEQHQVHLLAANVRLHVIVGHIVKAVYLRRSISRDVAEGLSEELKAWWKSLPPCAALKHGSGEQVVALHMSYLHAVTLLTRPFLQKVVEASIEEAAQEGCKCKRRGSGKSNAKRKMVRYAAACVLVAERTVSLAHRMRRKGGLPRNDAALMFVQPYASTGNMKTNPR